MRKHPYILATCAAILLAIVVWVLMPKKYTAITKLSDEYKEVDLAIGLDRIQARLNALHTNVGINDMAVYSKLLKTENFARAISRKQVPGKGMDYGHWVMQDRHFWQINDTIEAIQNCINYNYSNRYETLTIGFSDRNAIVAAKMLDIVTIQLQDDITKRRQSIIKAKYENATRKREVAQRRYLQSQRKYVEFVDSHISTSIQEDRQTEEYLSKEKDLAYDNYKKAIEMSVRYKMLLDRSYVHFAVIRANTVPMYANGSILAYIGSFVFIALVLTSWILNFKRKSDIIRNIDIGNIFSPWSITLLIWVFVVLCIYLLGDKLYPLTSQFYVCLSLWVSIFCVSSFITFNLFLKKKDVETLEPRMKLNVNETIFYVLLVVTLVLSPLCVRKVMEIINLFGTDNLMQNIRLLAVKGDGLGILDLSFVINKALFIVALWRYPKVSIWTVLLISLLTLMNSFAIMDKGTLFFMMIVVVFVLYEKGIMRLYHMAMGGVIMVVLFFVMTVLRGGTDESGNLKMEDYSILEFLAMYIFANPVAFGYLDQSVDTQFGTNTLYLFYYYLVRFDLGHYNVATLVQEFTYVPILTNLYTIMQPFFIDFGVVGVAFFALVYGVFLGWCYSLYKNGNSVGKCLYTYLVMVLVLQFGQEQIFFLPIPFIRICVLIYILTQSKFRIVRT